MESLFKIILLFLKFKKEISSEIKNGVYSNKHLKFVLEKSLDGWWVKNKLLSENANLNYFYNLTKQF